MALLMEIPYPRMYMFWQKEHRLRNQDHHLNNNVLSESQYLYLYWLVAGVVVKKIQ